MDMVRKGFLVFGFWFLVMGSAVGQEWTFGEAEKLPGTVNSAAEESMPLLSPDGRTLYFSRMMCEDNLGGKYAGQDIWVSKFDGQKWSKADNRSLPFNSKKSNNAVVGMSADGKTIYLLDASPNRKIQGIHFSKLINGKWTDPELIPIDGIASDGFVGFYVSPDFDVILISMKGEDSRGEEDLYVCLKDGTGRWSKPRNLGPSINTAGFEISPFLTADKKRLFFSSNGHPGVGDGDIFYCDRLYDSWETWTVPKNVNTINSKGFDGFFSMHDSLAYFVSNRDSQFSDLYTAVRISNSHKTEMQVKKILEEAKNLLGDISYHNDSLDTYTDSVFIRFSANSSAIDALAKTKLDVVAGLLKIDNSGQIALTSYSEDEALTKKRMQSIVEYLERASIIGLRIKIETNLADNGDGNIVELRY